MQRTEETVAHSGKLNPKTLACRQCYAAHNHKRTPEAAEFMEKYLDQFARGHENDKEVSLNE